MVDTRTPVGEQRRTHDLGGFHARVDDRLDDGGRDGGRDGGHHDGPTGGDVTRIDERPRRPRAVTSGDAVELLGSAAASFALTWLLFYRLTGLYGSVGFGLVWYGSFVPIYWMVVRDSHGRLVARDRMATVAMVTGGVATIVPLVWIVGYTVAKGVGALSPGFFTNTLATTGPLDPATEGGALHSIVGTVQQTGIAMVISVPMGLATAIYLNEVNGRSARIVRFVIDAMSGLPSVVAGLFIYAVWVLQFRYSGFAAGLSLAVLMLPTITRTSEEMLRLVPDGLREAALALGAPQWRTVLLVVLPTARTGLVTAVILGMARAVGETAPVLLTAAGSSILNVNPFSEQQDNLPLFIWAQVRSSVDAPIARAWTGALVLIGLVLFLFTLARILAGRGATGARSRSRPSRRSPR